MRDVLLRCHWILIGWSLCTEEEIGNGDGDGDDDDDDAGDGDGNDNDNDNDDDDDDDDDDDNDNDDDNTQYAIRDTQYAIQVGEEFVGVSACVVCLIISNKP